MTNFDGLTGLANRPAFDTDLVALIKAEQTVSIALIDVNGFHELNQTCGVEAGDRALTVLAEVLKEQDPGAIYRIAGDEFAVVMADTPLEQAFLKMELTRREIEASVERFGLPDKRPVTVGIGVAQYPRDAKDVEGLMRTATSALGYCKEIGSNQVILPLNEEMVMKSCYYTGSSVRRLKVLAERLGKKESLLLREALLDLLRKYETRD